MQCDFFSPAGGTSASPYPDASETEMQKVTDAVSKKLSRTRSTSPMPTHEWRGVNEAEGTHIAQHGAQWTEEIHGQTESKQWSYFMSGKISETAFSKERPACRIAIASVMVASAAGFTSVSHRSASPPMLAVMMEGSPEAGQWLVSKHCG